MACAHREVQEEAGVKAQAMTSLGKAFMVPGYSDEVIHFFLATDLEAVEIEHDHDEVILETQWFTPVEINAMIEGGDLTDGKTLVGLYRAFHHLFGFGRAKSLSYGIKREKYLLFVCKWGHLCIRKTVS